ncbi:hypothetical protein [Nitriliruptor alkaliphilus]|uniref:hypothetical protein n=1 Tax=Nitriliruptor alkaliphilus TaxID=427918 RepID=UPI000695E6D4|nr:hypothetical protein [Nitriliruptor alkaliphilus]
MHNLLDATKRPVQIAIGLAAVGFVLIILGWNGAANFDTPQQQVPYLISGGVAGLGLVIVGVGLLVINEMKRATALVLAGLERAAEAGSAAAGPTAVPGSGPMVVAGRATYHLPTCRLVAERKDLQTMSPSAAIDRGLAGCRICDASQAATA